MIVIIQVNKSLEAPSINFWDIIFSFAKVSTLSIKELGKLSTTYYTYDIMKAFVSDKNLYLAKSQYSFGSLTGLLSGNKKR